MTIEEPEFPRNDATFHVGSCPSRMEIRLVSTDRLVDTWPCSLDRFHEDHGFDEHVTLDPRGVELARWQTGAVSHIGSTQGEH